MSIEIKGRWKKGFAHDGHTLSSVYMGIDESGHNQWETTRSEMGELVYQLKYQENLSSILKIVNLLDKYKGLANDGCYHSNTLYEQASCHSACLWDSRRARQLSLIHI